MQICIGICDELEAFVGSRLQETCMHIVETSVDAHVDVLADACARGLVHMRAHIYAQGMAKAVDTSRLGSFVNALLSR